MPKLKIDFLANRSRYSWNEKGMGFLFADVYKDVSRYVAERKSWMCYNGKVWKLDVGDMQVSKQAKKLVDAMISHAADLNGDERSAFLDLIKKLTTVRARENMIRDAASVHNVPYELFDKHPFLLNCQNGTVNLKDFTLQPHNPEDYLSMISNAEYHPDARCPRWETFVGEVMENNLSMQCFLQKAFGYALTGDTQYECMFYLIGFSARNGKGTMMESIRNIMGDYAVTAQPETIAQKYNANSSAPSEDMARLKGARMVSISEPEKGLRLDVAKVKQLTGRDILTCRRLNENSFEYMPEYKIFVNGNHLPHVTDMTIFDSDRLRLIPFNKHFDRNERDTSLKEQFRTPEAMSGILNWCVQGLYLINELGFDTPPESMDSLNQYRDDSDLVGKFIEECLVENAASRIFSKRLYTLYSDWSTANGYKPMASRTLLSDLRTRGYTVKPGNESRVILGLEERLSAYSAQPPKQYNFG